MLKRKVTKIYLDNYSNYICIKKTMCHVDKLIHYYLLYPVV